VAERTIFQHFPDRDALFLAVAGRQTERLTAMWEPLARTGPFEERLDAFVEQRAQILEVVTPVRRGALLMEPFSEAVSNGLAGFRELKRREAERVFEPELDRLLGPRARDRGRRPGHRRVVVGVGGAASPSGAVGAACAGGHAARVAALLGA
jgi:AcrR family transcriptional regulator